MAVNITKQEYRCRSHDLKFHFRMNALGLCGLIVTITNTVPSRRLFNHGLSTVNRRYNGLIGGGRPGCPLPPMSAITE
jgi:hypothetical protein